MFDGGLIIGKISLFLVLAMVKKILRRLRRKKIPICSLTPPVIAILNENENLPRKINSYPIWLLQSHFDELLQ